MLIYVVKPGDTLWRIAANNRVSVSRLIEVNGLPNPNQLLIGQSIIIPTEDVFHTVIAGETLWRIAQTYGTTVESIIKSNQLVNPNNIYPGLTLYIPPRRHTILSGERLSQIARRYNVSLSELLKVNSIQNVNLVYPGIILVIPRKSRPVIDVNGYIYFLGESAIPIVREDGEHLTYLSPFAYLIREDGTLQPIRDDEAIQTALEERVVPMMSITNFTSTAKGENVAHIVLTNPEIVDRLLSNIITIMRDKRYEGLNIDFENVLPEDRIPYNQFLQQAVDRLHAEGFFVSTALAPKVSGQQVGLLYEAHDYEAHGRIADFVVLMTYEWGWRKGPPQAISPLNQIKRVLDYALTVMPKEKIFFGFQIYARDWLLPHITGQEAQTFSVQEAIARAAQYSVIIQYDTVAQSPFYRYTDAQGRMHEVWFEDARSAQAKFDLVKSYGLAGISYWALGYPYPQNWTLLEDNFTLRKLI
jgi:spore germination protein